MSNLCRWKSSIRAAKAQHDKMYKSPGMSVQSRAMDLLSTNEKVITSYGRQNNVDGADNHYGDEGDLVMGDKADYDVPEPVDMVEEMRGFLKFLKEKPMQEWEKEDKSHYKAAWRHLRNAVLKNAGLIITTCNAVEAPGIRNCFGHNQQPIMVIVEECSMENDTADT